MEFIENLIGLRDFCRQNKWPRIAQWHSWIYTKNPIAIKCVKKIAGRYMIDKQALEDFIKNSDVNGEK